MNNFISEHNVVLGILSLIIGLIFFVRGFNKTIDRHNDKDYMLMSFSIKILVGGIGFLMMALYLLTKNVNIL